MRFFRTYKEDQKKQWRDAYDKALAQDTAEERFGLIYKLNLWKNPESVSGSGSTLKFTKNLRSNLPKLFKQFGISSVFDAPCGDMNWMPHVLEECDITYIGGDIVEDLINKHKSTFERKNTEFIRVNLITDQFPTTDLMLCRDCLFHISYNDILKILKNFIASNTKYLFTTTYNKPEQFKNKDIVTGGFRSIDLGKFPFDFPAPPLFSVRDHKKRWSERMMCLWDRGQIIEAVKNMSKNLGSF